jgi:hypothetical protein
LRRRELNIGNTGNGLNGFSMGAGVKLGKLWFRYARAYYQSGTAFNQIGLNMQLNQYFGLGKTWRKNGLVNKSGTHQSVNFKGFGIGTIALYTTNGG